MASNNEELKDIDQDRGLAVNEIIESVREAFQQAKKKEDARMIAFNLYGKIGAALDPKFLFGISMKTYVMPYTNEMKKSIDEVLTDVGSKIVLNVFTPDTAQAKNDKMLKDILAILEEGFSNNTSSDDVHQMELTAQKHVSGQINIKAHLDSYTPPPPLNMAAYIGKENIGSSPTDVLNVADIPIGPPPEASHERLLIDNYRPGGESEKYYYNEPLDARPQERQEGLARVKAAHEILRNDYLSTPDENFERKSAELRKCADFYLEQIKKASTNIDLKIIFHNYYDSITSLLNTSPRVDVSARLIPLESSGSIDSNFGKIENSTISKLIIQNIEIITDARQPEKALNELHNSLREERRLLESDNLNSNSINHLRQRR
ncbi:MAG: hypothetical protein WCO23_02740 [bacterium]